MQSESWTAAPPPPAVSSPVCRCTRCPCMEARHDEWERLAPCLNVIRCHSLFILPPSSLHAKANLILGLLIVGAFSQAFFQFTSISSSRRAPKKASLKREEILVTNGSWFKTGWQPLPTSTTTHSQPLFFPPSFLFLMSCSFPVKWIITVGIILVTWHYLDEVNNWNLCLKGFYLVERNGSAGRAVRERAGERAHTFV